MFRGPPKGLNIHAGFATQQAARAFITKKFKGTRRLQVRGRPGLVKSGHNPKVAANWKTFSLAASLKAAPAPRRRKPTTRRNSRGDHDLDTFLINEWVRLAEAATREALDGVPNGLAAREAARFYSSHYTDLSAAIARHPDLYDAVSQKAAKGRR